jgi:tetratricopeptide (TPR) repeat protein
VSRIIQSSLVAVPLILILPAAIALAAQDFSTHNQRGVELSNAGRHREAIAELEKALRLAPSQPVVRRNLAHARGNLGGDLLKKRAYREAAAEFQGAIDLSPEEARFHAGLGVAFLGLRELDRAIEALTRARDISPQEAEIYRVLGEAYYYRGEISRAVLTWEEGLRVRPGDREIERLIAQAEGERRVDERYHQRGGHHFTLRYVGEVREELGREILALLERAYEEVGYDLNHYPRREVEVVIYSDVDFQTVTDLPAWVLGAFDERGGRIRIPIRGLMQTSDLRGLLYHEYTHVVVRDLTGGRVPTWLNEGLALHLQRTPMDGTVETVRQLAVQGTLRSLASLEGPFVGLSGAEAYVAYASSYAATKYFIERWSLWDAQWLLRRLGEGASFEGALREATRLTPAEFEREWVESLVKGN